MQKRKLNKEEKLGVTIASLTVGFIALNIALIPLITPSIYKAQFKKVKVPDYSLIPGLVSYERDIENTDKKDNYPRENVTFKSDDAKLQGYIYRSQKNPKSNKLVVFSHGINSGADDYLNYIAHFLDNGYHVFAFDSTGTYKSEGSSLKGFPQMVIDLENALRYIDTIEDLKTMNKYLVGHSWGAFASASVLNYYDNNVNALALISSPNDAGEVVVNFAKSAIGPLAKLTEDFVLDYQIRHFGTYALNNAVKGLNKSCKPAFIANGKNDKLFPVDDISLYSYKNYLRNENNEYYLEDGKLNSGHTSILFSEEAIEYQNKVKRFLATPNLSVEGQEKYIKHIQQTEADQYSEVNKELVDKIDEFFDKH